eukprot:TRINITY_DN9202_c0_g1_i6.p1 TRINITY_DN9202_c0_g1~~TRINITY_DN9202_c0_g1_i6.p1  ORF type:complete len:268 (+),score=51.06 TRINITY_DN9202_c0_g1_i6:48-806(+)
MEGTDAGQQGVREASFQKRSNQQFQLWTSQLEGAGSMANSVVNSLQDMLEKEPQPSSAPMHHLLQERREVLQQLQHLNATAQAIVTTTKHVIKDVLQHQLIQVDLIWLSGAHAASITTSALNSMNEVQREAEHPLGLSRSRRVPARLQLFYRSRAQQAHAMNDGHICKEERGGAVGTTSEVTAAPVHELVGALAAAQEAEGNVASASACRLQLYIVALPVEEVTFASSVHEHERDTDRPMRTCRGRPPTPHG